ncbi:MAG TPA: hypothetical protein VK155_13620 [Bacteroidales bacterium]|jgi:hypothetical protein|nr:hypothetical protein [Bacteroidales bacterium]
MLPFGSITSIIPLSVLAIAYALFICASALNRIKPATETSQDKEIIVRAGEISADQPTNNIIYYTDIQDIISSEKINNTFRPPEWFCCKIIEIPPEKAYSGYCNFSFSRPPPSFFS